MLKNRSIPQCTVIPVLAYPDVNEAVEWLCKTFGFTVRLRIGDHRVQLNVADGAVVVTNASQPQQPGAVLDSILVRVERADDHHADAKRHGAKILQPPADQPYGERQYVAEDLLGRRWTFSQSVANVKPEDWGGTSGQL